VAIFISTNEQLLITCYLPHGSYAYLGLPLFLDQFLQGKYIIMILNAMNDSTNFTKYAF